MRVLSKGEVSKKNLSLIAIISALALIAVTTLIVLATTSSGEATKRPNADELKGMALDASSEYLPGAASADPFTATGADTGNSASFNIRDASGKNLGVVGLDPATGEITMLYKASGSTASTNIKFSLDEARKIAEDFLSKKGVLDSCVCEQAELKRVGVEGPPDQLVDVNEYVFSYRPYLDGLPVYEAGGSSVWVSPEDGSIFFFSISPALLKESESASKPLLTEEDARDAAIKQCSKDNQDTSCYSFRILNLEYKAEGTAELRYNRLEDGSLKLVWLVNVERQMKIDDAGQIYETQDLSEIYQVDAITGEAVLIGIM